MKSSFLVALTIVLASSAWTASPRSVSAQSPYVPTLPVPPRRPPMRPELRLPTLPGALVHAGPTTHSVARRVRRRSPEVPQVPPPIELSVTPKGGYLYDVTLRATQSWGDIDAVFDRRLLTFSIKPTDSKRSYKCSYTGAPSRVRPARVERVAGGAKSFTEWFDVRMYCWGRALSALQQGGELYYAYGFSSASKNRWIARRTTESLAALTAAERRKAARPLAQVKSSEPLVLAPLVPTAMPAAPVRPELRPTDIRVNGGLTFHVAVHSTDEKQRVYLRGDMVSFDITGQLGHVTCLRDHSPIVPIADFFSVATKKSGPSVDLDARAICPAHTFSVEGIYEVRPFVVLPYDGAAWRYNAATGRFDGEMSPIRVTDPDGPYVDHTPAH